MRILLFSCFILICSSKAQTNDFSESFIYFPQNIFLNISAYSGINTDGQASLAYRSYTGQLSNIRTFVADINYNIQKKSKSFPEYNKHILGGGFYAEKEGDFINRNRILLRYVWHKRLTHSLNLSGAATVNLINYVFTASNLGVKGTDMAGSGGIGAAVYTNNFRLGFFINDVNQPALTPLDVPSKVYRYYVIHTEKSWRLVAETKLVGSARGSFVANGYNSLAGHIGIIFREKIGFNSFAHNSLGWGIAVDLNRLEVNNNWMDLSIAYRLPYSRGYRVPYSAIELNLNYYFLKFNNDVTDLKAFE